MSSFVHLEVHSAFSFLWGTFSPEALVDAVKAKGQKAVALTDILGVYGAVRFCRAARKAGIQPIVGAGVRIEDGSWITLIAKTFEGYGNLCRIVTAARSGPRSDGSGVPEKELGAWAEGLVCLAGGHESRTRSLAMEGKAEEAALTLLPLRRIFGEDLFITLCRHVPEDDTANEGLFRLSKKLKIPVVATNRVTFLEPMDFILHRTLAEIRRRHHHETVEALPNESFFLAGEGEMAAGIPWPEAIENTKRVAERCGRFSLPVGRLHPPRFLPSEEADTELARAAYKKLARTQSPAGAAYIRQLDRELRVVGNKGLSDFFLLVRDVVDFANSRGIRNSIRGSAAGSLLVHLLHNGPDPLRHGLLFERFVNEGRGDMPDIDIDFDSERRDEVIEWVMERYPGRTAMVATIASFRVRSAVRLAARALGYPLAEIGRLATCLPWSLRGIPLEKALSTLPELRDSPLRFEPQLTEIATRLQGLPLQPSVHLGGVIIAPGSITDWTPVGRSNKGFPVGQLDKNDVDALGLLKLDLLGLRMHTAIRKAQEELSAEGVRISLDRLSFDDPETYALLQSTRSLGVFQLESPGQRNLLGRLQPRVFSDLVAEVSLFRPGPVKSDMVKRYVDRRNGIEAVRYLHPVLKPVLEETYGVIVFQEQVLRIVRAFAGFSYSEADSFRRAMTKDRSPKEMEELRSGFMEGARRQGHGRELSEAVFRQVAAFAAYGFCKAHAVAFAEITYRSAWLKAHYPRAFYLGLLNAGYVGSYPPWVILNEARRWGIRIFPPHVNASGLHYTPLENGICVPFTVIRGIGPKHSERIILERERGGLFESREDFFRRVPLPSGTYEVLMRADALKGLPALRDDEERTRHAVAGK